MSVLQPAPFPFTKKPLVTALTLLSVSSVAIGQDYTQLDAMVVTAGGFEQTIADAPASISVIDREELEKKSYRNITDAVKNIPGLYVTGGGMDQDINIRGMSSDYTLYLVDGRPVSMGRSVNSNGNDNGKQIGLPPVAMIERVEVIRGPMSSLYGAEAMGGVINIITRKATDHWSGSISTEYTKSYNDINNDAQQVNLFATGPLIPELLSAQVNGSWQGTDESDFEGGSKSESSTPNSTRKKGGIKLLLTPDDNNEIGLSYDSASLDNTTTPGKSIALVDSKGKPNTGSTYTFHKDTYVLSHDGSYDDLQLSSYVQHDVSEKVQDSTKKEEITLLNTQGTYFWGEHVLTLGGQYKYEDFTDETNGLLGNTASAVAQVDRWLAAVYAEAEWSLTDNLNLTTGLRYNDDELFGGHLTPRVYANYQLTPELTFKGGLSTGYKQPGLAAATEGFGRGTGGAGSPAPHSRALIIGNPDLDPEKSTSYEAGFVYDSAAYGLTSSLMLFRTDFKDKISEDRYCNSPNADRQDPSTWTCAYGGNDYLFLSTYQNISDAQMQGVEATVDYDISEDVRLSSSYTYTDSEQKTGEFKGQPLNKTPKHMINASVDWQVNDKLDLWVQGNYRGKTSDYLSRTNMGDGTPGYEFFDVGLVYQLNDSTDLKAGLYNLANKKVTNEDYGAVLDGRNVNLGLTVNF